MDDVRTNGEIDDDIVVVKPPQACSLVLARRLRGVGFVFEADDVSKHGVIVPFCAIPESRVPSPSTECALECANPRHTCATFRRLCVALTFPKCKTARHERQRGQAVELLRRNVNGYYPHA